MVAFSTAACSERHTDSVIEASTSTHPPLRDRPTASSSSMYTIQGAESRACLKRSLTRALPTPDRQGGMGEGALCECSVWYAIPDRQGGMGEGHYVSAVYGMLYLTGREGWVRGTM